MEVQATAVGVEIMAPPGMEEMTSQLQKHVLIHGSREKTNQRK